MQQKSSRDGKGHRPPRPRQHGCLRPPTRPAGLRQPPRPCTPILREGGRGLRSTRRPRTTRGWRRCWGPSRRGPGGFPPPTRRGRHKATLPERPRAAPENSSQAHNIKGAFAFGLTLRDLPKGTDFVTFTVAAASEEDCRADWTRAELVGGIPAGKFKASVVEGTHLLLACHGADPGDAELGAARGSCLTSRASGRGDPRCDRCARERHLARQRSRHLSFGALLEDTGWVLGISSRDLLLVIASCRGMVFGSTS